MSFPSNMAFLQHRLQATILARGEAVQVRWQHITGATTDGVTGAELGSETVLSGTLCAIGVEEAGKVKLRQFNEIQMGDLVLDVLPDTEVELYEGQIVSGTVSLASLKDKGVRFVWNDEIYNQAEVGEELAAAWELRAEGEKLLRTILLRKST